ncbi:MAG: aminoglycoside phosphotransferase, partial [Betaproteobacteria bacterium]|nr:aminoglycoside phosphotransferase [Betaproteobacteria bacterium]
MSHPTHSSTAVADVIWADSARQAAFAIWLSEMATRHGLLPSSLRIASADASFRRYLRVDRVQGGSHIIMDAPPDKENSEPFVRIAALMKTAGLNAPDVLDWQQA